jgi:RNA polymerase sigma-70 factor (ECF subfamily)
MRRALALAPPSPRVIQAAIHGTWCARSSLDDPAPWSAVLALYDLLLTRRDDVVVRLNRAVALAEVAGVALALAEIEALDDPGLDAFLPYHAARADLLRRAGRGVEAAAAYDRALALEPSPAERLWLDRRRAGLA